MIRLKCGKQPLPSEAIKIFGKTFGCSENNALKFLDDFAQQDSSFKGAFNGGISETAFMVYCMFHPYIKSCEKITKRKIKGDFKIITDDDKEVVVEIKECDTKSIYKENGSFHGIVKTDTSDFRTVKFSDGSSAYINFAYANQYDLLAVSMLNVDGTFNFYFIPEKLLTRMNSSFKSSKKINEQYFNEFLSTTQKFDTSDPNWTTNIKKAIDLI